MTQKSVIIVAMFMLPYYTALTQPMNQNLIRLTKLFYRKSLLAHLFMSSESKKISKCLKIFNLKDAIFLLNNAWENLTPNKIKKCWHKIQLNQFESNFVGYEDDLIPLSIPREIMCTANKFEGITEITQMMNDIGRNNNFLESQMYESANGDDNIIPVANDVD